MKYIKKSVNLVNSYPILLLALIPNTIINILAKLLGTATPTTGTSIVSAFVLPFLAIIIGLFINIFVTKIAFVARNNNEQDYDIDMQNAFKRGIPRMLLNSFTAVLIMYAIMFALIITIALDVVVAAFAFDSGTILTTISAVFFGIDGLGKSLLIIFSTIFLTIYIAVFLIFLNTDLTINSMMKASLKYTFKNFKKLFGLLMLLIFIPMAILLGSVFIYNFINGLSLATMYFMQTWPYVMIQFLVLLGSILFYISVVLTWNDEENKEYYLNADRSSSKPAKKEK